VMTNGVSTNRKLVKGAATLRSVSQMGSYE
jgi:hypothetical protein